ncbi:MAG: FAD-dependent oxidoreductase, partial [Rhodospirillaceae bacterium]|nr:FAD-dependent oxidoreductase [Rhodospirillaceae bacterium]
LRASSTATVDDCVKPGDVLYRRFWEPLTLAVLNATPAEGSADLMRAVLLETVAKGADACRPLIARTSLADALVDPAIAMLEKAGVQLRLSTRVRGFEFSGSAVRALAVDDGQTELQRDDLVVLAVPAWVAETLVSGLKVPPAGEAIVNVHYRMPTLHTGEAQIIGVVGGLSQWVFLRGETASVTISAAGPVEDMPAEDIAAKCWPEVVMALGLGTLPAPTARVVKERRATPAQTPAAVALRPQVTTAYDNLLLAGDWTATGLPATIEAAIRSGFAAANVASKRLSAAAS